jgi:hypothetical protein
VVASKGERVKSSDTGIIRTSKEGKGRAKGADSTTISAPEEGTGKAGEHILFPEVRGKTRLQCAPIAPHCQVAEVRQARPLGRY